MEKITKPSPNPCFQGIQDNKQEMEMKKPKIDIKLLKTTEFGDTSSFSQEIERALEISVHKLNNQDMKDVFKKKVIDFVQKSVLEKGKGVYSGLPQIIHPHRYLSSIALTNFNESSLILSHIL